MLYATLTS